MDDVGFKTQSKLFELPNEEFVELKFIHSVLQRVLSALTLPQAGGALGTGQRDAEWSRADPSFPKLERS